MASREKTSNKLICLLRGASFGHGKDAERIKRRGLLARIVSLRAIARIRAVLIAYISLTNFTLQIRRVQK